VSERVVTFVYQGLISQRLDKYLVDCLYDYSRNRLQHLIKEGCVKVQNEIVNKTGFNLENGFTVEVHLPSPLPSNLIPEKIPLKIVFENDDLMLVDKPAGMVVHPSAGHETGTLIHAALAHAPEIDGVGGEQRPGVVHRLDKDTSGLILLAKNDSTHRWLQDQFRLRKVEKIYLALVDGHPPTRSGRVEAPVGRDLRNRKRMAVTPLGKGREAITVYQTLERFENHTLLEIHPYTGRTHQIRVHLSFLECPITGDTVYGHHKPTLAIERHFLHAARLSICLRGEKEMRSFSTPLPAELEQVLSKLRKPQGE
jgi:23S rRNA pseudouridine1911/1915/1917 synthase